MASKFSKAGSASTFASVAKVEQEKAQVVALQNISTENLVDNPKNGEDITMTSDLEESMKQNGFTDPMEVTDFGMESGKYMILSGHRRRAAGVKVGITVFPCVVRHFNSEQEVQNYTLMANSQRDSAKDPCLFCTRYKLHEDYLISVGFKGSVREEVAKRLGISVQQADRYNAMNKIILPVWDMVRAEQVGMSSVMPLAAHRAEEQLEIYEIMQDALKKDVGLTRNLVKQIVDAYREGKRSWAEIADLPRDSGLPLNSYPVSGAGVTRELGESERNDEVRRDYDPIAAEYDAMDRDAAEREQARQETDEPDEDFEKEEKPVLTEAEKQFKMCEEISKQMHKLDSLMSKGVWKCETENAAREMVANISSLTQSLIEEMYRVSKEWDVSDDWDREIDKVSDAVRSFK